MRTLKWTLVSLISLVFHILCTWCHLLFPLPSLQPNTHLDLLCIHTYFHCSFNLHSPAHTLADSSVSHRSLHTHVRTLSFSLPLSSSSARSMLFGRRDLRVVFHNWTFLSVENEFALESQKTSCSLPERLPFPTFLNDFAQFGGALFQNSHWFSLGTMRELPLGNMVNPLCCQEVESKQYLAKSYFTITCLSGKYITI